MNVCKFYSTLVLLLLRFNSNSQIIHGDFSIFTNQTVKLEGFNGLKTYPISKTITDKKGNFSLCYDKSDYGIGYLISDENKPLFVVLNGENIELKGQSLKHIESIKILQGTENQIFEQYSKEYPRREQALSAWIYLDKIYNVDSLFSVQKVPLLAIQDEKLRIQTEEAAFINNLPKDSYMSWYLPIRKLMSSVPTIAQYQPDAITETIKAFRKIDYTDLRLYKSGLFKDAIESHFWLLENSGNNLDKVFEEMKISIDTMLVKLVNNEKIFNEVTDYLFDLLEKHSLFQASEYLALKVLNEESCTINNDLAKQLETYRAMKKGKIAPEIIFTKSNFSNPNKSFNKLSDVKSRYTLVVFGANWCQKCNEELPNIAKLYEKWKSKEIEVIYIGLENQRESFIDFTKNFSFSCYSDLKKWNSKIVNDYYVFSTPTMFLLDIKRTIILRPNSVNQMDAWVDWNIK